MTSVTSDVDPGAEREVDLARWGWAILRRWWLPVAGLIAGALLGAVLTLVSGSTYSAAALVAPGQAFSPSGSTQVLTYLNSPGAINEIANSEAALTAAAAKAGIGVDQLRGHVTAEPGSIGGAGRGGNLISITVEQPKPKRAEDAANALAQIVQQRTTSDYVKQSMTIYNRRLANYAARLKTLGLRLDALNNALTDKTLTPLDRLVLVSQLDLTQARQGALFDQQTLTQEQLTLARDVSLTQIVQEAVATKLPARSKRNSMLVGAVIGLILGAVAAIVVEARASRAGPA